MLEGRVTEKDMPGNNKLVLQEAKDRIMTHFDL